MCVFLQRFVVERMFSFVLPGDQIICQNVILVSSDLLQV